MTRIFIATAALLLATTAPIQAQDLYRSATTFCNAVRNINKQGLSAAPGSVAGTMIASQADQSSTQYRQLWQVAKALGIPACKAMW
jgi:hypothetical protein